MAIAPKAHAAGLDLTAAQIEAAATAAFDELRRRIRTGEAPRDILDDLAAKWSPKVAAAVSPALSKILATSVSSTDVLEIKVGEVSLSRRLYDHAKDVNGAVRQTIERHVKGFADARALALDIFEGYDFRANEVLAVDVPLPKYIVEPFRTAPGLRRDLARVIAKVESAKLKTPALKAAYTEALNALEAGKGDELIARKLRTAYFERNRYLANRIAQTELHRAQSERIARETMGDEGAGWVQIRLSRTHPEEDVCDFHAKLDAYGMGAGVYPKADAPLPPFHPFCRCVVRPRTDIDPDEVGEYDPGAAAEFFRDMDDKSGARIAGSAAKLEAIRSGARPLKVFDAGKDAVHRTRRLGGSGAVSGEWSAADGVAILAAMKGRRKPVPPVVPPVVEPEIPVAPPPAPVLAPIPTTKAEAIAAGREEFDRLVDEFSTVRGAPAVEFRRLLERGDNGAADDFGQFFRKDLDAKVGTGVEDASVVGGGKGAALVRLASTRYPNSWTESAAARTPASGVKVRYRENGRGWCTWDGNEISTSPRMTTAVHEYGHRLQKYFPALDDFFRDVHAARTAGEPLQRLKDLHPTHRYRRDEVTRKDGYVSAYQGKEYPASRGYRGGPAEVLTMAFQNVLGGNPYELAAVLEKDPEMFFLVLGLVYRWRP